MLDKILCSRGWQRGDRLAVQIDEELSDDYPVVLLSAPGRRLVALAPELEVALPALSQWLRDDVTIQDVREFLFGEEAPCEYERAFWLAPKADAVLLPPGFPVVFDPPAAQVEAFARSIPERDWEMGGPIPYARRCAVVFNNQMTALASGRLDGGVLDLSYVVHPDFRGRGMGQAALSALIAAYPGAVPLWRTEEANTASMNAAHRRVFLPLVTQVGIYFREE